MLRLLKCLYKTNVQTSELCCKFFIILQKLIKDLWKKTYKIVPGGHLLYVEQPSLLSQHLLHFALSQTQNLLIFQCPCPICIDMIFQWWLCRYLRWQHGSSPLYHIFQSNSSKWLCAVKSTINWHILHTCT